MTSQPEITIIWIFMIYYEYLWCQFKYGDLGVVAHSQFRASNFQYAVCTERRGPGIIEEDTINAFHAGGVDKFKFDNTFSKSMGLYQELLNQY